MKFTLSFKTPDVLDQLNDMIDDPEEKAQADLVANKFLKYGEYVNIEFDTENQTAKVLPK